MTTDETDTYSPSDPEKRTRGGIPVLDLDLPADESVIEQGQLYIQDRNAPLPRLGNILVQDPVTSLELLRMANALFFSQNRPSILSIKTAIVRLGIENLNDTFNRLIERPKISDENVRECFENLRKEARTISQVARLVASIVDKPAMDVVQAAGLMINIGHMLACIRLNRRYSQLAATLPKPTLAYRLSQEHQFDIQSTQLSYLRMRGLPQLLFYALDRDLVCKTPGQSTMRFIVTSAQELVHAFHGDRWERYATRDLLPSKSSLRLLRISDAQFNALVYIVETFLNEGLHPDLESLGEELEEEEQTTEFEESRQAGAQDIDAPEEDGGVYVLTPKQTRRIPPQKYVIELSQPDYVEAPQEDDVEFEREINETSKELLSSLGSLCESCGDSSSLLEKTLALLVEEELFDRAALLVVSDDRQSAYIHVYAGDKLADDPHIPLADPLSPLALCLNKVKSFNTPTSRDTLAPFGISSYALAPIKAKHDEPVALYADCGSDKSITMERRKVFRRVVGLLNKTLPSLPGGLPRS